MTKGRIGNDVALLFHPLHRKGLVVTDELIHHSHHSADSCHCCSSTPTSQLHSSDCMCEHIPGKSSCLLTWKHNHTHTHLPTRHVLKLAIHLALHIYGFTVHTCMLLHRHIEVSHWANCPHSPFSQSSGPVSVLIVCGGL